MILGKHKVPTYFLLLNVICLLLPLVCFATPKVTDENKVRDLNLTQTEQQWLKRHKVVRHGLVKGQTHLPFEFTDPKDRHQGLTSDYLAFLTEKLGIQINTQFYGDTIPDVANALERNDIDFVTYMPKVAGREQQFAFSSPVIKMPVVLFGHQDSAILSGLQALEGEELWVQYNSYADTQIRRSYPKIKVRYVYSTLEGLKKVINEPGSVFIHNVFSSEYYIRKYDLNGIKVVGAAGFDYNLMFAASKSMAPFIGIVEKAIADLSEREKRLIFDKWINIQIEKKLDIGLLIRSVIVLMSIALFIIGLFYYWNRQLAIKVHQRTVNLRNLARHIETVREDEKARLARELHDELGHNLTALAMNIRQLKNCQDLNHVKNKAQELSALAKQASSTTKQIMSDLRPSILEDLGLIAALDWLVCEFSKRHQIQAEFDATENDIQLPEAAAIALFRITQESLTNIAKHAKAKHVFVQLDFNQQQVCLTIKDDGVGLKHGWSTKEASFGLQGMKERANGLGGHLQIQSNKEKGVQITVSLDYTSL